MPASSSASLRSTGIVLSNAVTISDEVRRAGRAVDEGDAVEEERRREAAEDEVLHPALLALRAAPVAGGQHVEAPATSSRARGTGRSGRWPAPITTPPAAATSTRA